MVSSKQKPYCHTCLHCEVPTTGSMLCVATIYATPTRMQREQSGLCGIEGRLYEKREEEYETAR